MPKGVYKKSDQHKIKLSESQKLNPSRGFLGKHHTEKVKKEHSIRMRGRTSSRKGAHLSEKTKKLISKNHANFCGKNNPAWKAGTSFLPYCSKFNKRKKEEIRNEYDRKCYLCGKLEKDNKYKSGKQCKLSIHHIDSDKQQGCNGTPWKLVPLCIHCHNSKKMEQL